MDTSKAKQFLRQVEFARQKCIQILYKLAELKTTSKNLIANYDLNIGGGSGSVDISGQVVKIDAQQKALEKAMTRWSTKRDEVDRFILALEIPEDKEYLRTLLLLKYVALVDFTEIAYKLGFSYNYVIRKLHVKALELVEKNLKLYTKKSKRVNDVQ